MQIIIVYASAGKGHTKAAKAIYGYLKNYCPWCELELVDILDSSSSLFRFSYRWGYYFLVNFAPRLWQFFFWLTHTRRLRFITRPISELLNRLNTKNFIQFLFQRNPDFIISTHFLPAEIASFLKEEGKIASSLVTVITDFGVHDFWRAARTDLYIVAAEYSRMRLLEEGVEESRIKVWGIPVEGKFFYEHDRKAILKELGLKDKEFTLLISTGSFALGRIAKIVSLLQGQLQILVVCADNHKLYTQLKRKNYPGVKVFGFVDNLEELMAVADAIITKPGGLTISESLSMGLVPIFITAIYGQESENLEVLLQLGIGLDCRQSSAGKIRDAVLGLKENPHKLKALKQNNQRWPAAFPVEEFCNALC
jgi:processive 1,2-diacylglycerol beta-glucosyltransferase